MTMIKGLFAATISLAGLTAASNASAAITVYTTQASYLAAISNPGVDTYDDLPLNSSVASPATRTAGSFGYTAAGVQGLYSAGLTADRWLSTENALDALTFTGFTGGVRGFGGLFFANDAFGAFIAAPSITLTVTDASGATTSTIANPTISSFLGFVSTTGILTASIGSPTVDVVGGPYYFATANDLTLGGAAATGAVPEPATWGMMIMGLGVVGAAMRRRVSTTVKFA